MALKLLATTLLPLFMLHSCLPLEMEDAALSTSDAELMYDYAEDFDALSEIEEGSNDSIDRASFIKNYLAAQLSEYEGDRADAAFYYNRAERAYPSYKSLKEKAFAMQLLAGEWESVVHLARELILEEKPIPLTSIVLTVEELKQGNLEEARRYAERAMKTSPKVVHLHLIDAYLQIALGRDPVEAAGEIRDLPYSPLMSPVKHYHLGNVFMMADDLEQAEMEYTIAYEQDSRSLFTVKGLANVLEIRNRTDKLEELFKEFFAQNPDNIMLLETYEKFRKGESVQSISSSNTVERAVADVLFNFATLLSSQNATISSHQLLNMALALDPENNLIQFYKGILFEQEGFHDDAYHVYQNVQKDSDVYAAAQIRTSGILQSLGKLDDAIEVAKHLHEKYDLNIFNRILAELYYTAEYYDDAVDLYSEILTQESNAQDQLSRVYFARGSAYERLFEYDKATIDLQKSIDLKPNNPVALNYLGYMLVDLEKDIARGMSLISKALLLSPNDSAILDSMGWAWYKSGEFEKALVFLERAVSKLPEDPTINMHLGDTYKQLGQMDRAKVYFERALKFGPETDKDAKYIRKQLARLLNLDH